MFHDTFTNGGDQKRIHSHAKPLTNGLEPFVNLGIKPYSPGDLLFLALFHWFTTQSNNSHRNLTHMAPMGKHRVKSRDTARPFRPGTPGRKRPHPPRPAWGGCVVLVTLRGFGNVPAIRQRSGAGCRAVRFGRAQGEPGVCWLSWWVRNAPELAGCPGQLSGSTTVP